MQFMNLGRCSHPIRGERAGAKSKSKGSKVTVENSVVVPEGRSRLLNSPLGGYSQHKETANTSHRTFWSIQVFAPLARVQMHQDHVWTWLREGDAESGSECPSQLLRGHFACASPRILWIFLKDSAKKSPEMPHACFTCCPAAPPKL